MDELFYFGDQTGDDRALFARVFTRKDLTLFQAFIERAYNALQAEIGLGLDHSETIPDFSSLQELVDLYYAGNVRSSAIDSALTCVAQFAHFFVLFEERTPSYPRTGSQTRIVGSCTGLLAATAVASADSLTSLLPLSLECIRIAFRMGMHAGRVATQLDCTGTHQSWSTSVATTKDVLDDAINSFHEQHNIKLQCGLWISAFGPTLTVVSGPPSLRRRFFQECQLFKSDAGVTLPIHAPYHAAHLYSEADIAKILRPETELIFAGTSVRFHICSSDIGAPSEISSGSELLKQSLRDILIHPLRRSEILRYCAVSAEATKLQLFAIGDTRMARRFARRMKPTYTEVILEDVSSLIATEGQETRQGSAKADIAIVGMSGRFSDAADHELLWQLLEKGVDAHRTVPEDRWPVDAHTDPTLKSKNTCHTPYGNFIQEPGLFDARFFGMSPREAAQTDPMQRLMITTAYEAMEMSGIVPGRTKSTKHTRIGTFYGQTSDDWREVNAAQDIGTYYISGGIRAFGPGRVSYFFKFAGPSYSVDTACSSSFAAINLAVTSLRAGDCDTAFAGGTNIITNPDMSAGLARGHFLSRTGSCKTWDNAADGYCRADGVCTVILKRLDDAMTDRDPILGVIRGIGTNHSAQAVSITHPCVLNQQFLFRKVLRECNVDGREIDFVEMHGTGTQAGDAVEMESVTSVFAPRDNPRNANRPLYIGAVKSNVGHGEAASGVTSLIKALLMLKKNSIPPHVGIKGVVNKKFASDLHDRGLRIPTQNTSFPRPSHGKRMVFINNFSAAGGNTALLLEDAPEPSRPTQGDSRSTHIIAISAKSEHSIRQNIMRLMEYLRANPTTNLADLAYTTTARRMHYSYRMALSVDSVSDLSQSLEAAHASKIDRCVKKDVRVAFAYTGQGSQYTGMGKALYQTSAHFRRDINDFDQIAIRYGFPSIKPAITGSEDIKSLSPTVVQLGMCCVQMALTSLLSHWNIRPDLVIGHSLGEYAALQAAGVLSVADTIFLVGHRARLLEEKCKVGTHAMVAVKIPLTGLQDILMTDDDDTINVEIACINGVSDNVLAGPKDGIEAFTDELAATKKRYRRLSLPFAFHSSQVEPMLPEFEKLASTINYNSTKIPVISPLLGEVIPVNDDGVVSAKYLARHCRETVDFVAGLTAAKSTDILSEDTIWMEVGSHPICSGMIRSCLSKDALPTLQRQQDPWDTLSQTVAGLYKAGKSLNWDAFHQDNDSLSVLHNLPVYAFEERNHWIRYKGDWLLDKGERPILQSLGKCATSPRKSLSSSVQAITKEEITDGRAFITAESNLQDTELTKVVHGHAVNGVGLCPSTLYADMAYTLCKYASGLLRPGKEVHMNISDMKNPAPLLLSNVEDCKRQIVHMSLQLDVHAQSGEFNVYTYDNDKEVLHASSTVKLENGNVWEESWNRTSYLIQSRIDHLTQKVDKGEADKIGRRLAYRLFSSLVDYSPPYQNMQSVLLDGLEFEAVSELKFKPFEGDGQFHVNPYMLDSALHLSGFVVNAATEATDTCYISHGWSNLRILSPLAPDSSYTAYVKMHPVPKSKARSGDVWVFDSNMDVVGVAEAISFQCVSRKILNHLTAKTTAGGRTDTSSKERQKSRPSLKPVRTPSISTNSSDEETVRPPSSTTEKAPWQSNPDKIAEMMQVFASEMDMEVSELDDSLSLSDLGVDSLASLTIAGKLREEFDVDLSSDVFSNFETIHDLRKHLGSLCGVDELSESKDDSDTVLKLDNNTSPSEEMDFQRQETLTRKISVTLMSPIQTIESQPAATSVLLQGNLNTARKTLFLFPDGSGSATSYGSIPNIDSKNLVVYGLNCPFMKTPSDFTCGIEEITRLYLDEILRLRPQGPYMLGGWSAGGVLAYEATRQLLARETEEGHDNYHVERLLLLDAPRIVGYEPLPKGLHEFFDEIGIFGSAGSQTPDWLLPHFEATVEAMSKYRPGSINSDTRIEMPRTLIVCASDGVCGRSADPQPPTELTTPHSARWLLYDRDDAALEGWDELLGSENCTSAVIKANHFSLMKSPAVDQLAKLIRENINL